MLDLFRIDSSDDEIVENADWVEINTLFRDDGTISREDIARAIYQARDVKEDKAHILAEDVFKELENRSRSCGNAAPSSVAGYPFELVEDNYVLRKKLITQRKADAGLLYLFLLTVTRADMASNQRTYAGLDPTRLFEKLCADVLIQFWGGKSEFADVMNFGTAGKLNGKHQFPSKIDVLCKNLCEGIGWKAKAKSPKAGDSKLDLAVWRRFKDNRRGGLVGFAQCKTGIHWRKYRTELVPRAFCGDYMQEPLLIDPIKIFMVPCRINETSWNSDTKYTGLLFDRCRITQYGTSISPKIISECRTWLEAIFAKCKKRQ